MKNMFYTAAFTAVFFGLAALNVTAAGKNSPVSRSNVSNNRAAGGEDPKDQDCDGRSDAPDCKSAAAQAPRDQSTGMSTGRRMHKPMAVTQETDNSTTAPAAHEVTSPRDQSTGMATGKSASANDGCCPGRCCPPDAAQDHAINTKGTGTAGIADDGGAATPPAGTADAVPAFMKNARKAKTSEAVTNVKRAPSSGDDGCCPGRCCPPGSATTAGTATSTGAPGGGTGNGTQPSNFTYPILPAIKSTLVSMPETDPTLEIKR